MIPLLRLVSSAGALGWFFLACTLLGGCDNCTFLPLSCPQPCVTEACNGPQP